MKILFLGEENNELYKQLKTMEDITQTNKKVKLCEIKDYDFIISFGYRHIVKKNIIDFFKDSIINLHISFLPYNRGTDPNLWSIITDTPSGVTIHIMDEKLDTGDIVFQEKVNLDYENDTLSSSYNKLQNKIIELFLKKWNLIKYKKYKKIKQNNDLCTIHYLKDRPKNIMPDNWDTKISKVKELYNRIYSKSSFKILDREIGPNHPTYIIAELSCNHNQDKNIALKLIEEAHKAGADAIKLQTYTQDTMTIDCSNSYFTDCLKGTLWEGETLYQLYSRAYTPWEWTKELKDYANSLGMHLFSSPFDTTAVDFLENLDIPAYKIASFEIVDHVLIKRIAQTGKPVIISSGMASFQELQEAIDLLRNNGCKQICMLKCTSAYPAKLEDANLITMKDMSKIFNVITGLSDHTLDIEVPITSVLLGGCVIEKHFTLSRESGSPDDAFSLIPEEFKKMVDSIRKIEKISGKITYGGVKKESTSKKFRKSLFVVEDIKKGEKITSKNIRPIRPAYGMHTKYYELVMGETALKDISRGTPLQPNLITCSTDKLK